MYEPRGRISARTVQPEPKPRSFGRDRGAWGKTGAAIRKNASRSGASDVQSGFAAFGPRENCAVAFVCSLNLTQRPRNRCYDLAFRDKTHPGLGPAGLKPKGTRQSYATGDGFPLR